MAPRGQRAASSQSTAAQLKSASRLSRASSRVTMHNRRRHQTQGSHQHETPMKVAFAIVGAIVAIALGLIVVRVFFTDDAGRQRIVEGREVTITIAQGSDAQSIARQLFDEGLIASKSDFLNHLRKTDQDNAIKSGTYTFVSGLDIDAIVARLIAGPNASSAKLTIPEGLTLEQIAAAAEKSLGIRAQDFIQQAKAEHYVKDFPFLSEAHNNSLEGYLFPKTYDFSGAKISADSVIRAMLVQYKTEIDTLNIDAARARLKEIYQLDLSTNDIVTMASLIEREALTPEQRPKVASVFYNRLAKKWRLESDATLTYSIKRSPTPDDLKKDDPYNTYTRDGLTPTPICSPGIESLKAACAPEQTDYYFFFILKNYERFSKTIEEHNIAIKESPRS